MKTKDIKHIETCSIFNFLKKGMRLVPPPHFRHIFSRKMFIIYVLLRLSSLPKILGNMYILIIFSRFVTSSWLRITLAFFSNRFSTRPKTVWNILRKIHFFVTFKGLPVARDCHRPDSVPSIHRIANHQIPIKQLGLKRDTFSF